MSQQQADLFQQADRPVLVPPGRYRIRLTATERLPSPRLGFLLRIDGEVIEGTYAGAPVYRPVSLNDGGREWLERQADAVERRVTFKPFTPNVEQIEVQARHLLGVEATAKIYHYHHKTEGTFASIKYLEPGSGVWRP